ncbi:MAG TPA: tryptophan 7-halogenase [Thermoanaerobaculia bacterium]
MIEIVGGGPAGATLALSLARLGHEATLVERGGARTDGESLNPGIWRLFDALGLRDVGGLRIHRSLIRWDSDDAVERHHRLPQLAVLRASFDAYLRELAGVPIVREIHGADFVVDASGRASWSRPNRVRTSEPMLAMRGIWRGEGLPSEARVEALEDGWIWGAPMPDGSFAAIACIDPDPRADESRYFAMLSESLLFRELRGECTVHFADATTYAAESDGVLRIGDASHTLDPLSSSGVRSAMQSALHTAIVLNTMIRRPDDASLALQFYAQTRDAAIREHREWTSSFYAESRFREAPFWRARSAGVPPAVQAALPATLTLSPDVEITDIPCVVGDFIESRRGVTGVARPFVWLGGVDAATLLAPLAGRELPRETLLAQWRVITPHAEAFLKTLLRDRVVV